VVWRKRDGLGKEFVDQVDAALEKIALNPLVYGKVIRENWRCTLAPVPLFALCRPRNYPLLQNQDDILHQACNGVVGLSGTNLLQRRMRGQIPLRKLHIKNLLDVPRGEKPRPSAYVQRFRFFQIPEALSIGNGDRCSFLLS
jgi:hypothetical protein